MPTLSLGISMSPNARYTTAQSTYDRLALGPCRLLSDKRIAELCRAGRYGTDARLAQIGRDMAAAATKKNAGKHSPTLSEILTRYGI